MKKLVAIAMCAALTCSLAACGSSSSSDAAADTAAETTESAAAETTEESSAAEETADATELSGTVATDGSTSMEKVIGSLGEAFMSEYTGVSVTYNPTGSGSGITAVSEGNCDIGLSSRHLKDEETGLEETVLCLDGIAVIVNTSNSVTELTLDQVAQIYTGQITNWSELGGDDTAIAVIGREAASGTRDGFESATGTEDACAYSEELTSTGDVITSVSNNPGAIGYASLASVGEEVATVAVDGVTPSEETVVDGTYPIQRPFCLITVEGEELSDVAQAFYDYCISSDAADIISGAGCVPIY